MIIMAFGAKDLNNLVSGPSGYLQLHFLFFKQSHIGLPGDSQSIVTADERWRGGSGTPSVGEAPHLPHSHEAL